MTLLITWLIPTFVAGIVVGFFLALALEAFHGDSPGD